MSAVKRTYRHLFACLVVIGALTINLYSDEAEQEFSTMPRIKNIFVTGSKTFPEVTIKSKLPYHVGQYFSPSDSNQAIMNIHKMGHFKQITLKLEPVTKNTANLHIIVEEKPALNEVTLIGNKHLSKKELKKKIDFEKIPAAERGELSALARIIKKTYTEKGYHFADVDVTMEEKDDIANATFSIKEGPHSVVKRVRFVGNSHFHDKKLRSLLFTREDWILAPLDRSGNYIPLAIEQDKLTLENFYQSNGYLHARVTDADVVFSDNKKEVSVTFKINEGDLYRIDKITAPGNDIFSEKQILSIIPFRKGSVYSRELIRTSMERIKTLWGDKGYIYADVEPSIQPDDKNKTVDLAFYSDLGNKVKLNRINIFGNKKTRDKVIRRQFLLDEGDNLTTTQLDISKNRVSGLGYFDPKQGVNWKINRIDEDRADIDLMLQEVKTGRFEFKLSYGGSPNAISSANSGVAGEIQLTERNLFGKGMIANTNALIGQDQRSFSGGFTQPWLFDRPINIGISGNYANIGYDELRKVVNQVQEQRAGGIVHCGFVAENLGYTMFNLQSGIESLHYYSRSLDGSKKVVPEASITGDDTVKEEYQKILTNRFQSGKFAFVQLGAGQDLRNHHTHISQGYKWNASAQVGIPSFSDTFGFYKFSFDGHWYTPLINETDLVLHLHGHIGYVNNFKDHAIPFRELYNIGGQASIRGWTFGQVGPMWYHPTLLEDEGWQGEAIGSKKAAFFNVELVFPLTEDLSMKGVVFYDGGAGWDTPNTSNISPDHLKNDKFDYRHSIGVGLRMLNPQPIRIDWGFKLDKRTGEKASEVSFSSYYDF
jgi:outer membrane protein insertion porin family